MALFIDGPADGEYREVQGNRNEVHLAPPLNVPALVDDALTDTVSYETVVYTRRRLHGPDGEHLYFFSPAKTPDWAALEHLFRRYAALSRDEKVRKFG